MKIKTKLTFKEYLGLMFTLTYRNGWILFIAVIGILDLLFVCLYFIGLPIFKEPPVMPIILGLSFTFLLPVSIFLSAKKNFYSNARLQEEVEYEFYWNKMKTKGSSFNSEIEWKKSYKIVELKKWFLIYQSRQVANLIPKRSLDGSQLSELRNIFRNLVDVKVKLK